MANQQKIVGSAEVFSDRGRTPRYVCIANDLRKKINKEQLLPGMAIPSQTVLMREYGVALGTVRQVLHELRSEGLIDAQRGKGTFVVDAKSRRTEAPVPKIGLAYVGTPIGHASIPQEAMLASQKVFSKHCMDMVILGVESDNPDKVLSWAAGLSGVMLFSRVNEPLVCKLQEVGKPVVVVGDMNEGACPAGAAQVTADVAGTINMAMGFVASLGHRRICLVHYTQHHVGSEFCRHFDEAAKKMGLAKEVSKVDLISSIVNLERESQIATLLSGLSPEPTALLVSGGMRACRVIRHLEQSGRRIPEDLSVVAINGRSTRDLSIQELSRVDLDNVEMLQGSAEAMLELINNGHVIRKYISPKLHWGRTCLPIGVDQRAGLLPEEAQSA